MQSDFKINTEKAQRFEQLCQLPAGKRSRPKDILFLLLTTSINVDGALNARSEQ
jgi:hypothetical protein